MGKSLAEKEKHEAREARLRQAIANDDVAEVHELIVEEPELLDRVSKHPFPNTPLHVAAEAGKTQVAMEMAILKPLFARKLNTEGYSPMHLALQCEQYQTVRALITLDPNLIRVRGRCGITPLHYVAWKRGDNELELLAEFLCTCKLSIEDLTSRCETAVHVAVKNHNLEAFKVLFRWLVRVYLTEILAWKDEDGNTALHIAVLEKQPEIIKLLIRHTNVITKNFKGETAMEIFQANPSGDQDLAKRFFHLGRPSRLLPNPRYLPLSQFLSRELGFFELLTFWFPSQGESARVIILGMATLIATATYQAALTPPGGYWQDNSSNPPANSTAVTANSSAIAVDKPHQAGNIILNGSKLRRFTALNSTAFLFSLATIWFTAVPLLPRTLPVYFLMGFVGVSFSATAMIEFPESDKATGNFIKNCYATVLFVVLVLPLLLHTYIRFVGRTRADAPGRRVGNLLELKDRK